jgi:hypothetical protein
MEGTKNGLEMALDAKREQRAGYAKVPKGLSPVTCEEAELLRILPTRPNGRCDGWVARRTPLFEPCYQKILGPAKPEARAGA